MSYSTIYDGYFAAASEKYGVDYDLLRAVAKTESGFNRNAVSSAGAVGIMQLMPGTAAAYGVTDSKNAAQNIDAGAHYLSDMLKRFDGDTDKALAAYNRGASDVQKNGTEKAAGYISKVKSNMGGGSRADVSGGMTGGGNVENAGFDWSFGLSDAFSSPLEPNGILWWVVKILLILLFAFLCIFFGYKAIDGNGVDLSALISKKG